MYLTRMRLDCTKRQTIRALAAPNLFHGAIESSFQSERRRNLWRIDNLNGERYLMILSEQKPDLSQAARQFGVQSQTDEPAWESLEYEPLFARISPGGKWRFRLVANPTVSYARTRDGERLRGEVHAHTGVYHQRKWLMDRAEKNGFVLEPDAFDVTHTQWYRFSKGGRRILTLLAVTYEGVLTVIDKQLFEKMLREGIGRAKAYGMGLMTLTR